MRVHRRLVTFLAICSVVVCIVALGLWVQSYAAPGTVVYSGNQVVFGGRSNRGRLTVGMIDLQSVANDHGLLRAMLDISEQLTGFMSGFGYRRLSWESSPLELPGIRIAMVPHWFVAAIACIPALLWLRATRRHRRRIRGGLCLACGYDLRESRERCPECGTVAAR